MMAFEGVDMTIKFGKKIKKEPPKIPTFAQHLHHFYFLEIFSLYISFEEFMEIILGFILLKGTNHAMLHFKNEYFHVYDKKGNVISSRCFKDFSYLFNGNVKTALIPWANQMLDTSKRIHGDSDMKKYLDFYHVRYCTNLTPLERQYLERKGILGIRKAIKHLFNKNHHKKIVQ